ncbi:MAG: DNA-directed RNA polymerase subunit alpha [Elusimicrobia bacterium]|nr:DNA-directed RNA polymerase subunit alpha [Elusimicrobiota bacterium]MBD3412628.1 DNA-directed RNA polymerase subunit alpha [Elusimicrobiota bacterium]
MKLADLVIPKKLEFEAETLNENYGKFKAEPFERGYGHTVGNSLRRILLSSLEGTAVTAVRVTGAQHEYMVIKGAREDLINIILNLKKLQIKLFSEGPETVYLKADKEGPVKASMIQLNQNVEILNRDLIIAHLDAGGELEMEIEISRGRGFVSVENMPKDGHPVGTILVDAYFSPVIKVHYSVEDARVGQMTDYDRLIMEIWTNGSITPNDALSHAARILKESMGIFINPLHEKEDTTTQSEQGVSTAQPEDSRTQDILNQPVDIIELSVRASNCLKIARIKTIGDLVKKKEEELISYKNFGRKSLEEIKQRLKELNLGLAE